MALWEVRDVPDLRELLVGATKCSGSSKAKNRGCNMLHHNGFNVHLNRKLLLMDSAILEHVLPNGFFNGGIIKQVLFKHVFLNVFLNT